MTPVVTDHALLRWLERSWGVDVGRLRRRLAREAQMPAFPAQSAIDGHALKRGGLKYHFRTEADGRRMLVTVTSDQEAPVSNRALRRRRRHENGRCG